MKTLLIVDMQKGFINENNKFLVKNIEKLLKNNQFDNIFATKFVNKKQSPFVKFLGYDRFMGGGEINFAISLPKNATIIEKTSYALPKLELLNGCDEVYICGTDYDSCVLAICFQLFDNGIKPIIIEDCVGTHSVNAIPFETIKGVYYKNFAKK